MLSFSALVAWAMKTGAPPHGAWVLGYSGRRAGIEACLSLLRGPSEEVASEAVAGFRAATGFDGPRDEIDSWWTQNQNRFTREPAVSEVGRQMSKRRTGHCARPRLACGRGIGSSF
jgi:hypothetical protein